MAENSIVQGLFGVDPAQYQQQQAQLANTRALQFAQLDPMQQAQYGLYGGAGKVAQGVSGLLGVQDPMLQKVSELKQIASQFNHTTPEGLNQMAQALMQAGHPEQAQQAIALSQKMQTSQQENQYTGMKIGGLKAKTEKDLRLQEELAGLTQAQLQDPKIMLALSTKYGDDVLGRNAATLITHADALAAKNALVAGGVGPLTPAQKAMDVAFGKEYSAFVNKGGQSVIQTQLSNLDKAISALENKKGITGKMVGVADSTGALSYVNPEAAEVKDLVGKVVQSDLRQVLGGQFAQKEGEQLLARSYNPKQPQSDNLERLKSLRKQIADSAKLKTDSLNYFEANGSLKGFKNAEQNVAKVTETKKTTRKLKSGIEVTIEE